MELTQREIDLVMSTEHTKGQMEFKAILDKYLRSNTQTNLAKQVGVTQPEVWSWVNKGRKPALKHLPALGIALGVHPLELKNMLLTY